jgi:hypothetical protein
MFCRARIAIVKYLLNSKINDDEITLKPVRPVSGTYDINVVNSAKNSAFPGNSTTVPTSPSPASPHYNVYSVPGVYGLPAWPLVVTAPITGVELGIWFPTSNSCVLQVTLDWTASK